MKRLFSPWRSAYIASFRHETADNACLFCSAAASKQDGKHLVLLRRDTCFVIMNLYPYNNGHCMVVPYRHTPWLKELSRTENAEIMETTSLVMEALNEVMNPHGYNLGANLGRAAGAGIDQHIHFHIVPRWNGDTNFMPTLADVKLVSEDLRTSYRKLKRILGKR